MKNYVTGNSNPEAYITKGKQRVKQFGGIVYLNDGDNFEIEIFNPTSEHISAQILVNGKLISTRGLVLRPGERVFLERYLDTNNKFIYSTYEVNGGNEQVKRAIANNGIVTVKFHKEEITLNQSWGSTITYVNPAPTFTIWPPVTTPTVYYSSGINSLSGGTLTGNGGTTLNGSSTLTCSSFSSQSDNPVLGYKTAVVADAFFDMSERPKSFPPESSRKIETGTVEKGESSEQSFETVNRNFQYYSFHNVEWHILPKSQQPITSKDLKQFCTECGSKIAKSTYKFCPSCGEKIQ
jgi:hypothetical protein